MSRPYSLIEHLSRAEWLSRFRWRNSVGMFSAHFDESGLPDSTHVVLTVAGCVSSVDKWARFEIAWKKILKDAGLPQETIFHMNKFARCIAPYDIFKGDPARKAKLIAALVNCARRYVNKAFSCSVDLRDWERLNVRYCVSESLGYPYSFCGRTCVGQVMKWSKKNGKTPVQFYFEKGALHQGQLDRIVKLNDGIDLSFKSKESMTQFQIADLLAWKNHKIMTDAVRYDGPPDKDVLDSLSRSLDVIRSIPHSFGGHNYDSMERVIRVGKIPRRQIQK